MKCESSLKIMRMSNLKILTVTRKILTISSTSQDTLEFLYDDNFGKYEDISKELASMSAAKLKTMQ